MAGHTIIKMLVWCAGWEIAQGVVFHPWVLSPFCVPVPCFIRLTHHLHGVLQIERSYSATHKPHEDLLLCYMKICFRHWGVIVFVYEDQLQCLHGGDGVFMRCVKVNCSVYIVGMKLLWSFLSWVTGQ